MSGSSRLGDPLLMDSDKAVGVNVLLHDGLWPSLLRCAEHGAL